MESNSKSEITATNLKNVLWDVVQKLQSGEMQPTQADSISSSAREILRITSVQLKISQQARREIPVDVLNFSEK